METAPRLDDLIGYHLRRASLFDLQGAVCALEPVGMRLVQFSVLLMIVEIPGINSAEICRALSIQRANIVSLLADLEERGLILREADDADNRVRRLFPTRKGADEAMRAVALIRAHEDRMLARLSARECGELRRLLAKIWKSDAGD